MRMEPNLQNQQNEKPIYKRWWFWLILIVVMLFVVPRLCNSINGSSSSSTNSSSNSSSSNRVYGMNETVIVKDLGFVILDVYDTKQIGNDYLGEKTEYNYVVVKIRITNYSNEEKYISDSNFYYYRGENKYDADYSGIYLKDEDNGFYINETIGAGLSKTISVVYEIPSEHLETDYILAKDGFKKEKIYLKVVESTTN